MGRKYVLAAVVVLALTVMFGAALVPVSSASPERTPAIVKAKPSGLTAHNIASAEEAGTAMSLVAMAPQTSLRVLSHATKLGPHQPNSKIGITIGLRLHHLARLKRFLQQVQYSGSPLYHRWLTPKQFTARFGPSRNDVVQVVDFLKAHGIAVKNVSPNRLLIHTKATTATYEHAFGIRIDDYKLGKHRFYSTVDRPKLPRAIASLVTNVMGLNRGARAQPHSIARPLVGPRALNALQAPPASLTNLNPLQISHAYHWPSITDSNNGQGVTIAIITANSSGLAGKYDPHQFWSAFGLPDHNINVIPTGEDKGNTGGMGETLLDIEYSGAMAPGADLNVYVAPDPAFTSFANAFNKLVNDNTADVMTISWGAPETNWGTVAETVNQIFMQATAQGISLLAAAGDTGSSDGTDQDNMADFPSISPYVTAANGTQLVISDLSGTYGSETVWNDENCFGGSTGEATGGAISGIFAKPAWQHGPGVPADVNMRMNSGIALTASCSRPMLVLRDGGWYIIAGTSAVAPQLAGLFAIVVGVHGSRLGQTNKLVYADARNHYSTDFHDVTEGNNGAYEATADWDHPTGWGSVNAQNLVAHIGIQGPQGVLRGKVTAAATGSVIAGAKVDVVTSDGTEYVTTTADDGTYFRILPAGEAVVTVSAYGYSDGNASISISKDTTIRQDFALALAPKATLSGKVSDGSGHGYGLYAKVKISAVGHGDVASVWTDPETGHYSIELPRGLAYKLDVAAVFDGYHPGMATVTLAGNKTENFALKALDACTAPGYHFVNGGLSEDFNGEIFPPDGWTVANAIDGSPVFWKDNTDWGQDNWTGGTGTAADINSGGAYPYKKAHDSSLITPAIPVNGLHGATILEYKANYRSYSDDALDLGISTDGGNTWANILHWTENHGGVDALPGENVYVHLASYLPANGTFQLRWRNYDTTGKMWDYYAQIDDVSIGNCAPVSGGLLTGRVTDVFTGKGIVDATITDDRGMSTKTIANPHDPNLPVGTYLFFAASGNRSLTVTKGKYTPATTHVVLSDNQIVSHDFSLGGARFMANPDAFTVHVSAGGSATASFAISNIGSAGGNFEIQGVNAPPPVSVAVTGPFALAAKPPAGANLASRVAPDAHPHQTGIAEPSLDPHAAGDVVASFPASMPIYGLGVDHETNDLWLGSPAYGGLGGDREDHRFLIDGTNTGDTIDVANNNVLFMADMAFDDRTDMIWQVSVNAPKGATSRIYELDPSTMQPTGRTIKIPSPQSERGLAYNPQSNTWYAGDYTSGTIYHFDASGKLLDSKLVKLSITGLAYNSSTGHLFVLASGGPHAVYVLDANNGYKQLRAFDIDGFDQGNSGAGFGYTCSGNLVVSDFSNNVVYLVGSGESGWCKQKNISWLTVAPMQGTLAQGASATIQLDFDGSEQKASTTAQAYLRVIGGLGSARIVPIKVYWEAPRNDPPVARNGTLTTDQGTAGHGTLEATDPDGDTLAFSIVNRPTHGTVKLDDASTGAFTYTPTRDYSGSDVFSFKASDGQADSNTATIDIVVKAAEPPPAHHDSGGGGFDWLILVALLSLIFAGAAITEYKR